jgi:hypothetical protein
VTPLKGPLAALGAALLLAGCASGTHWSEVASTRSPPAKGQSRIVVYRDGLLGMAVQPTVSVDGRKTGDCQPNGAFLVDVPPGRHEVSAETEVKRTIEVTTARDGTAYVECSIGIGFFVGRPQLAQVPASMGETAVKPLVFTGAH